MPDTEACLLKIPCCTPWNKGKLVGAKPPPRPKHVWSIRTRLMVEAERVTSPCSIWPSTASCVAATTLKVEDIAPNGYTIDRATVRQRKTGRPVKFELTDQTRQAVDDYLRAMRPGHECSADFVPYQRDLMPRRHDSAAYPLTLPLPPGATEVKKSAKQATTMAVVVTTINLAGNSNITVPWACRHFRRLPEHRHWLIRLRVEARALLELVRSRSTRHHNDCDPRPLLSDTMG
jgi:hypothetical protein